MNNEQIVLWIVRNEEVYLKEGLKQLLLSASQQLQTATIKQLYRTVLNKYFEIMGEQLLQKFPAALQNMCSFRVFQAKNKENKLKLRPSCIFEGAITKAVPSEWQGQNMNKISNFRDLSKKVGSLLWIDGELVGRMMGIFSKAVADNVCSNRQVQLNFGFCRLTVSKTKANCVFKSSFLAQLNGEARTTKREELVNWLCKGKQRQFEDSEENKIHKKHWEQIKEGNLFDYPSLREIKSHLNRGLALEVKYRDRVL